MHAIAVWGYLAKSKWDLYPFSAWFFHSNVSYLILYQWTKFQCHILFLSQDIKQNVLLRSYLEDSWWHHKFWDFFKLTSKAMADREKKVRKMKIQKFEYLKNKKSFLDEMKNIFHSFWKAIIWWKINIWWKIADTSFKYCGDIGLGGMK